MKSAIRDYENSADDLAAGSRTSRTESGETVTYSLGAGDRLASWTGGSYQYDAAGCVTHITRQQEGQR